MGGDSEKDDTVGGRSTVALVTGGHSGIGRVIADQLAQRGVTVFAASRTGFDKTGRSPAEIRDMTLDVRDPRAVEDAIAQITAAAGTPQILVNAAGIGAHQMIDGHDDAGWNDVIDTNLSGCFHTIRAVLPGMTADGHGRIINIASTAARTGMPEYAAYCASKAGLVGLSKVTALEGAAHRISCNCISPTWIETEMMQSSFADIAGRGGPSVADQQAAVRTTNPQNRILQPDEVAALAVFLALDAPDGLTMEDIQTSGGALW